MAGKATTVLRGTADVVIGVVVLGLLINVTSGLLPKPLTEPWVAWPALLLVAAAAVALIELLAGRPILDFVEARRSISVIHMHAQSVQLLYFAAV